MNRVLHPWLLATALALCTVLPAWAAGLVEVRWIEPARYADIGRTTADRTEVMQILGTHLQSLGRRLPDGQVLTLEVTDINLAGELEPLGPHEVRILRGRADWPTLTLRYRLAAEGRTLKTGEARLSDLGYLSRTKQGTLAYEKRMIEDWFNAEFAAR